MNVHAVLKETLHRVRRSPRLSVAVVLCIALGMAATAAVATLISLTTYRDLPFPDAERLVRIWNTETGTDQQDALAWVDFRDLANGMETLGRMEAAARARLVWHLPNQPGRRVEGEAVSDGLFELVGVQPSLGRTFTREELAAGEPVMLLSHDSWGREFSYADDIIGTALQTSTSSEGISRTYTVIGVLPAGFHGTIEEDMPDLEFFIPVNSYYPPEALQARDAPRNTWVIGRLAEGTSVSAVQAEASALAQALAPEFAGLSQNHEFRVEPLGANWRRGFVEANGLLGGAALLLLAVALLNVAMLLVVRTMERRHELAIRAALGAGGRQLVTPILVESLALTALGGVLGLLTAGPLLEAFLSLSGTQIPTYLDVRPDAATLGITFLLMLIIGVAAAMLPAGAATRVDVNHALREGSGKLAGSRSASRWGRWMVGGQIAMSLALLLVGSLLGRSLLELQNRDLGFASENRLRMALFVHPSDVPDESALPAFADRLEAELMAEPGVRDVALLWPTLPMPSAVTGRLQWAEMPEGRRDPGLQVSNYIVHDGFFGGLDIPLIAGRVFDSRDAGPDRRTAVIGRSLAQRLGGPTSALNRQVSLNGTNYRIVGVVGDTMYGGPRQGRDFRHQIYLSYAQAPRRLISPIVHVAGAPESHVEALKEVLARVAPNSAVDWVDPVDGFIGWMYRDSAFLLALVAAFALSALLLAAVGLYAVLAQQVTAATTELGIRKALGASDGRILARVVRRGMTVTLAGIGAGLLLSLGFSRVVSGLLHNVSAMDPVAYSAAAGTLLAVALLACLLPARRAARIAPMEALRHE